MLISKRATAIRAVLYEHLQKRLDRALLKIKGTDATAEKDKEKQRKLFDFTTLMSDVGDYINQIQMATHIVKAIHPDPRTKETTNLKVDLAKLPSLSVVGAHVIGGNYLIDATGNGAFNKKAYEIYQMLICHFDGVSILELLKKEDVDAVSALSDDLDAAKRIAQSLAQIENSRCDKPASHGKAKQIYWLVGDDPHDDYSYHLLAPLYPTSLVHNFYLTLQDHRFSDASKEAREARKTGVMCSRPIHEYSNLAIQKLGGAKPHNISQLNSDRLGDNYLLASLPPVWKTEPIKPIHGFDSLFSRFAWRKEVRQLVQSLRRFLASDPSSNRATREFRNETVESILDELIQFAAELHTLEAGWSKAIECDLPPSHRQWLDPLGGVELADEEALEQVARDFANWLNAQLRDPLPMGDPEYFYWRKLAREALGQVEREVA